MGGTKKGAPRGVERKSIDDEGRERRANGWGKRRQKRHTAQGCRVQEVPGDQVEGKNTTSAGTEGGGQREWTTVQVDRQSKTGKEGWESGA